MSQTIVNLTLPVVTEKIDRLLRTYPQQPHQEAFTSTDLRQKLTAYVLSRLPMVYVTMENTQACTLDSPVECYSHEQHVQIEQIIHQGVESLMAQRRTIVPRHGPALESPAAAPSTWFG